MKTKIIPFDLETAKKIQAGEIKGKIKTKHGDNARVICWNRRHKTHPIMALVFDKKAEVDENVCYTNKGNVFEDKYNLENFADLVLEVPDNEPQFKPFDKVLVRNDINSIWQPSIFSYQLGDCYYTVSSYPYKKENMIPYEGNEHLVGTTDKPKED